MDVSDPTRTIIDLMDDPRLGGGIKHVSDILTNYLKSEEKNPKQLLEYGDRLGNRTVFKRLGFLVSRLAPQEKELQNSCRERLSQAIRLWTLLCPNK